MDELYFLLLFLVFFRLSMRGNKHVPFGFYKVSKHYMETKQTQFAHTMASVLCR